MPRHVVMLALAFEAAVACNRAGAATPPGAERAAVVQQTPTGAVALPPPFATPSAHNGPRIVARPANAPLTVPRGFAIDAFATGLHDARWMALAPNGDVFVTEDDTGQVIVLRDADGDGRAEITHVFATGLTQPFGIAFHPTRGLFVANTNGVVRFAYEPGQLAASGAPEPVFDLPGHGYRQHWTRDIVLAPDGAHLFVSVGSSTNDRPERDERRAAISEYAFDGSAHRVFASGLRNPVGMAFEPGTRRLFAVVNERDDLGDDLVPDYLTEVRDGGFYGWPYAYFGAHEDPFNRGARPDLVARTIVPDLSLGAHTAALGLLFYTGAMFPPDMRGDAFVALHGSWNRREPVGYRVVRVRFRDGRPTNEVEDFVHGWLLPDGRVWGRPVGLLVARDGALLVADDAGHTIWRVRYGE